MSCSFTIRKESVQSTIFSANSTRNINIQILVRMGIWPLLPCWKVTKSLSRSSTDTSKARTKLHGKPNYCLRASKRKMGSPWRLNLAESRKTCLMRWDIIIGGSSRNRSNEAQIDHHNSYLCFSHDSVRVRPVGFDRRGRFERLRLDRYRYRHLKNRTDSHVVCGRGR